MANNWFNGTTWHVTDGQIVRAIQLNNALDALTTSFDLFPAPNAGAPTTKGFAEVFAIVEPTANTHPLSLGGKINNTQTYAASTGSANAYLLTLSPTPAYTDGMEITFKANHVNTGAATLNVNSLGAKAIKRSDGTALSAGDIPSGGMITLKYDDTNFQILVGAVSVPTYSLTGTTLTITSPA